VRVPPCALWRVACGLWRVAEGEAMDRVIISPSSSLGVDRGSRCTTTLHAHRNMMECYARSAGVRDVSNGLMDVRA
jgi:hypothetical protein